MQAIGQAPRAPSSRRRVFCGITALVAFAVFLLLNFWPAWSSMPFFTGSMVYSIGSVDFALWSIIAFNVAFLFSDADGLHLFAHLITAVFLMFAFTRLIRDFPFALTGVWVDVVHWILVLGAVLSFLVIPATWWAMIGQGYEEPEGSRHRVHVPARPHVPAVHLHRHRHAS